MNFLKFLFVALLFSNSITGFSQKIWVSKTSSISFFSKTPLRDIEAENKATTSLINLETKDIAIRIPIKSFVFPNKLMQEHFNENYLESEKYPYAQFRGKVNEIIDIKKEGKFNVSATGKITIHGVERNQTFKGFAIINDNKITIEAVFDIALEDYKIDIPKIVFEEIAEKVKVNFKINYEEKKL